MGLLQVPVQKLELQPVQEQLGQTVACCMGMMMQLLWERLELAVEREPLEEQQVGLVEEQPVLQVERH